MSAFVTLAATGWELKCVYAADKRAFLASLLVRTKTLSEIKMTMPAATAKGYEPLGYVLRGEGDDPDSAIQALAAEWQAFLKGPLARFVNPSEVPKKVPAPPARTRERPTSPSAPVRVRERTRS